jgi:hypothetical protein
MIKEENNTFFFFFSRLSREGHKIVLYLKTHFY